MLTLAGSARAIKVTVPAEIDVKDIRKDLQMTQVKFSKAFGLSVDIIKHWESGRRTPEMPARILLTVIARGPDAVMRALHPDESKGPKKSLRSLCTATA